MASSYPNFQSQGTYSTDLSRAFPIVCQKAKSGVQLCHAVATFVTERAGMEKNYAHALLKLAQTAKVEDWSEQLTKCWKTFRDVIEHLAQERWAFASTMQTTIIPGAKAFVAQQEIQVQRLIKEGTKMRWAQQQMFSSLDKAKEKYNRKCQEAIDMIATVRRNNNMPSTDASSSSGDSSASKELTDKLTAGAGHLLTKMWDTTSAFGRNPLERQRSKLYNCLEEVIAAEKHYIQTVEYTNVQRLIVEQKISENLQALQLTEEQQLAYIRDVLMRMQNAFVDMFSRSQQFVGQMKVSADEVDELADIKKGFQSLETLEKIGDNRADLSINPFYLRMTRIQAMSDDGHRMIETINAAVEALITSENRFLQSLRKLLRAHEKGGLFTSSDLFSASSFNTHLNFLADEGATMTNGWMTVKDQMKLLLEVHQEFKSLLAEPVSLLLDTMRREYESIRVSTQEKFLKMHSTLCNETAAHKRLQQKLDTRSQDFVTGYSCLPGSARVSTNSYGIEATQALNLLNINTDSFNEKERRSEAKLRQLALEIRLLQTQLADSISSIRQTYQTYTQNVEVLVATYMENEKYRLQVSKNLLQSLAKAIEHMLCGGASVGNKALVEFEKIDPSKDIAEFIRINRQPVEQSEQVVAKCHGNDTLSVVMQEYLVSLGESSPENAEQLPRSPTDSICSSAVSNGASSLSEKVSLRASTSLTEDEDTTLTKEHIAGELCVSSDNERSRTEQDDKYTEAQPLRGSNFQKQFKLDSPEQVVESFSCALFLSNFPFHGRLYLTKNRICFSGWRDTIFVASFSEITAMEKKNTALIVPNAIEITVKGEKVFFTSFIFRDECFLSIQQLRFIKKETEALMSDTAKQPGDTIDATPAEGHRDSSLHLSDSMASTGTLVIPDKDVLLHEFDLLLDEEVAFSVETAFSTLWIKSDTFIRNLLHAAGMTGISLPPWEKKTILYTAVSKLDTFDASRLVSYTHNKKYMVGPSVIPTSQTQRYAYTPGSQLIVSTTTCISDVPYCDYFRVEHRWVFSATKQPRVSLLQVGIHVQWLKSTWLKKQIESTAVSEAKDAVKAWLDAALNATKHKVSNESSPVHSVVADPLVSIETQDESSLNNFPPHHADPMRLPSTGLLHTKVGSIIDIPADLHSPLPKVIIVGMLVFIYTMYQVCAALNQMQTLAQESLIQQRQQYELLKEILEKLGSR
ncbi:unnamed protein product [Peronospora belbahrii]|uniref:VASt domain-containing protein n=1 Tax=Peronospora belbahrii TaxID=622444 RepID=A0ABN8D119_9STRA|nr:unnamed protein product [Peronospora belbahrii]